jgi:hypothetical protein
MDSNFYFQLTRAFNANGRTAVLASGQAVVYYRLAMMSKDGDWIVREDADACDLVRRVLAERGARYRPGAPLDPRWLAAGWSSHFELFDEEHRRLRCDFFSRPPRLDATERAALFTDPLPSGEMPVVGVDALIRMKQTQRAKDYPVIGELARLLPPDRELDLTTDPDRILALAAAHGEDSDRPAVVKARNGDGRLAVVLALAEEIDVLQQRDRLRLERYENASREYVTAVRALGRDALLLPDGHEHLCKLAERLLPRDLGATT